MEISLDFNLSASDVQWDDMPSGDNECGTSDFKIDWRFSFHTTRQGFIKDITCYAVRVRGGLIVESEDVKGGYVCDETTIDTKDEGWDLTSVDNSRGFDNRCPESLIINLADKTVEVQFAE